MRHPDRRAKIICTLGPSVNNIDAISTLVERGMDVARLNFSHGTHEQHRQNILWLREVSKRLHIPVAILVDIQGPKIRTGRLQSGKALPLKALQEIYFRGRDASLEDSMPSDGSRTSPIDISYARLAQDMRIGDVLLFDDGLVKMAVTKIFPEENLLLATVQFGKALGENKGVNMPGARLSTLGVTEKDWADILFAVEADVDFIALSFVRSAREVRHLKEFLEKKNSQIQIISKIEKSEAIEVLDEILQASDAIMVARGDLGVEIGNEHVPLVQKQLVNKARAAGKPVIIATQMLMSMVDNASPSRAEASDVANAVFDGADALMLSNETASGKYPFEAVTTMNNIIKGAEGLEAREIASRRLDRRWAGLKLSISQGIGRAATSLAEAVQARCIVCLTTSGKSARILAQHRPSLPIFAFTESEKVSYQLCLSWGVYVVTWTRMELQTNAPTTLHTVMNTVLRTLGRLSMMHNGDLAVLTCAHPSSHKTGSTNAIMVKSYPPVD